jgi:hypothetical protein
MDLSETGLGMNKNGISSRLNVRTIHVQVDVTLEQLGPGALALIRCLRCGAALDLHQPSADLPERLIGVCSSSCDGCGSWHILNSVAGREEIVIALLPPCEVFLDAFSPAADLVVSEARPNDAVLSLDGPMAPQE